MIVISYAEQVKDKKLKAKEKKRSVESSKG